MSPSLSSFSARHGRAAIDRINAMIDLIHLGNESAHAAPFKKVNSGDRSP
jgi:hypothetical protein